MTQDASCSAHFSHFKFVLYSNWNLNFPINHIVLLQVSCDWILCCDWYALHGVGWGGGWEGGWGKLVRLCLHLHISWSRLVLRGQTLFPTEGKCLGHGHRAVCCLAPWSAYQSQHSIQSHDTWSMWLTRKFQFAWRANLKCKKCAEQETSWVMSCNTAEIKIASAERSQVLLWRLPLLMSWLDLHD